MCGKFRPKFERFKHELQDGGAKCSKNPARWLGPRSSVIIVPVAHFLNVFDTMANRGYFKRRTFLAVSFQTLLQIQDSLDPFYIEQRRVKLLSHRYCNASSKYNS